MIGVSALLLASCSGGNSPSQNKQAPLNPASSTALAAAINGSQNLEVLPSNILPSVTNATTDSGVQEAIDSGCSPTEDATTTRACTVGDTSSKHIIVLLGDSHAQMLLPAFNEIGLHLHYKVEMFAHPDCPSIALPVWSFLMEHPFTQCTEFNQKIVGTVNALHPSLVVLSSYMDGTVHNYSNIRYTPTQVAGGIAELLEKFNAPHKVVIGDVPILLSGSAVCLSEHPSSIHSCGASNKLAVNASVLASESLGAKDAQANFINPSPWFCSEFCPEVISNIIVFYNPGHITAPFAIFISGVLQSEISKALSDSSIG